MKLTEQEFKSYYRRYLLNVQDIIKNGITKGDLIDPNCMFDNDFAPGIYIRTIYMPKTTFLIGKTHKTEHFNIVRTGKANVMLDGEYKTIKAGDMFSSLPGQKKAFWIFEDMAFSTVHPTIETDLEKLESMLVLSEAEELKQIEREIKELL
jgi:quercetin dioxygenase-like cupin family protein